MVYQTLIGAALGLLGALQMPDLNVSSDADRAAARIALLVLRAGATNTDSSWQLVIMPTETPVSLDSAVELLVAIPKPIACRGRMSGGNTTIVTCDPIASRRTRLKQAEWARRWSSGLEYEVSRHCRSPEAHSLVEVVVNAERHVFPLEAVQRWLRDYWMRYQIAVDPPSGNSAGVMCVSTITIRPGGEFFFFTDSLR